MSWFTADSQTAVMVIVYGNNNNFVTLSRIISTVLWNVILGDSRNNNYVKHPTLAPFSNVYYYACHSHHIVVPCKCNGCSVNRFMESNMSVIVRIVLELYNILYL